MKRKLSKKDILKYLEEINKKLEERGKYGEIMICGGAVMTLVYEARNSTHDIDAVFRPKEDMKEIIDEIRRENNLNSQWLNDDVSMFTSEFKNLTSSEYKNFGNLTVSILGAESLLAMKLVSARENTYDLFKRHCSFDAAFGHKKRGGSICVARKIRISASPYGVKRKQVVCPSSVQ